MFYNKLKDKLKENSGKSALGAFVGFPSTQMVEMAAYNGFDVVVIDNEHGLLSPENVEHMVIAAENAGVTPLVRVVSSDAAVILKTMDRGAHGVHVPQVDSKEEAQKVVEAVKYPPLGKRGAAFSMRAAQYGTVPIYEYLEHANQQSLVCIHIESGKAMENLEDILSVEGIDIVYIGPTDLSVSMGYGGRVDHPEVLKSIDKIYKVAKEHGVKVGIHTKNKEGARQREEWGADYVSLTVTSLINQSFKDYISGVKTLTIEK
ncbi:HpcH/HpaI aldolase family protein [Bacillus sp. SG-1]|uniref:HpcH/HpaI aldolase family protein n=1 Tax=Bacillus sp. SG-1 TaxID=161544 RepID=UPI0001543A75|nr:aldolase/citrate lyase family protein [Bacillus sp. SG-1]EDL65583.1 putative aldolase [Bacillus sp. SG-1]